MNQVPKTKISKVRLDARTVILLRDTGCNRAHAMASASTDLNELSYHILAESEWSTEVEPQKPGPAAMEFGQTFEIGLLKQDGKRLKRSLLKLLETDRIYGPIMKQLPFGNLAQGFARVSESGSESDDENFGTENIWKATCALVRDRATNHEFGHLIFQGVLKIPSAGQIRYLIPDVLMSPPGCSYYIPFEIKSHERMGHLTDDRHVASATVQSSLYLYSLMNGTDENGNLFPESLNPRSDLRTGVVFRSTGTRFAECMLVSAERDLIAIEGIIRRIPGDEHDFRDTFGVEIESIRDGDLAVIESIDEKYSDSCIGACRLATRCKERLRSYGDLSSYGNGLGKAYPGLERIVMVKQALAETSPEILSDPDNITMRSVETEIDKLIKQIAEIHS